MVLCARIQVAVPKLRVFRNEMIENKGCYGFQARAASFQIAWSNGQVTKCQVLLQGALPRCGRASRYKPHGPERSREPSDYCLMSQQPRPGGGRGSLSEDISRSA